MGNTFYFEWEVSFMEWLQGLLGETAVTAANICSILGEELVLISILAILYLCYDKKIGLKVGINMALAQVLYPMIKNVFIRRRPYMDHASIECLRPVDTEADLMDVSAQGFSFPSGHSTNSVIAYGSLAYYLKKPVWKVLAIVIPILVGFSRVVLGNHYPTDVLVGWALGAAVVFATGRLLKLMEGKNRLVLYLIILGVSCIGCFFCRSNDYFTGLGLMIGILGGDLFEQRFTKFENTRVWWRCILRVLGAFVLYFGLSTLMKLPFSEEFLASTSPAQYLFRVVRYAIVVFIIIGVYPMCFRLFQKKSKESPAAESATGTSGEKFECPCCERKVFVSRYGRDICPYCRWQQDRVQEENPDYAGGANKLSLNAYREEFRKREASRVLLAEGPQRDWEQK